MFNLRTIFKENSIEINGCVPMKAIANMLREKVKTKGAIAYGPINDGKFILMRCNMKILTQEEFDNIERELKMLEQYFGETNYRIIHYRMHQE